MIFQTRKFFSIFLLFFINCHGSGNSALEIKVSTVCPTNPFFFFLHCNKSSRAICLERKTPKRCNLSRSPPSKSQRHRPKRCGRATKQTNPIRRRHLPLPVGIWHRPGVADVHRHSISLSFLPHTRALTEANTWA